NHQPRQSRSRVRSRLRPAQSPRPQGRCSDEQQLRLRRAQRIAGDAQSLSAMSRLASLTILVCSISFAEPKIFWASEPANPGDVIMLYGGDLKGVRRTGVGSEQIDVLQASDQCLKFQLPAMLSPGT